ncbi:MAG: sigma-70 family RNA polymerase sigma factor [Myxococcales bacterium]|nr:sigma-70 family RNA polymerase sigma factor [Myxococcales bacterium]
MGRDHARFERLVRPVLGTLYRFAVRLTRDPVTAEDLVQQSLLRGLARLSQLQDDGAFEVWQCRVLYTTFLNSRPRRDEVQLDEGTEGHVIPLDRARPDRQAERRQLGQRLSDAMDGLPADQREAVWLIDGQGLSFAEAAGVLGVPPGTVASRVARGRLALRGTLAAVAADEGVGR